MATKTLTYVLLGRDQLSPVAKKAGAETEGAFTRAGRAASMMGTALAASVVVFGVESVKAAVNFQSSMEKIHTQAGASQKSVALLSNEVLKLGTQAQQSPKHLADALYHLKSVGLDDAEAMKALKVSSDLAAVGGADLESTTNALAGAWRSGIKGAESFGKTASTVNAIIGAGNMRMEDFTLAIGTGILPAAKTFGVSLQSVGSALALMTDEGVPADDAATRLKMSLSLLGAPSGAASKELAKIGINGLQMANAMRGPSGLVGAISLLKSHLDASGMSASQQAILLSKAFGGGRSSSAILTMVNNLDVLKKKQDQVNATTGRYGDAVAAQRKTAQAQFAILKANLDVLAVRVGSALLPPLVKFAQFLSSTALPAILRFTSQAGPTIKTVFGFFTAGLSAIIHAFGMLPGPVKVATIAIVALGIAMKIAAANPWTALALAVILLTGLIVRNWGHIKAVTDTMFRAVSNTIQGVWNWIKSHWPLLLTILAGPIGAAAVLIVHNWNVIKSGAITAVNIIIGIFRTMINVVLNVFGAIVHGAAAAFGWVPGVGGKLKSAARAFDTFRANVNSSLQGIQNKTVSVSVAMTSSSNPYPGGISGRKAAGSLIRGPGGPTSDTAGLFALSNGEYVVRASSVAKYGVRFMDALNAGRMAAGGGVNIAAHTPSASSIGTGVWSQLVKYVQKNFMSAIGGGFSGSGGGAGVQRWAGLVAQILAMYGQPLRLVQTVLRRMNQESGGNPRAINLWDSNAQRGDPSRGLMQTIMATFLRFAGPFAGRGIYDPFANIYASFGYALHTYGSLANAFNRAGGYALGGPVSFDTGVGMLRPGYSIAHNGTGRNEFLSARGSGGNTFVIHIAPTPLAHPADIGREVVGAIREYEKRAGKGWRS